MDKNFVYAILAFVFLLCPTFIAGALLGHYEGQSMILNKLFVQDTAMWQTLDKAAGKAR